MACVQAKLTEVGLSPGPADGHLGKRTRKASHLFVVGSGLELPELTEETSAEWCATLTEFVATPEATRIAKTAEAALRSQPDENKGFKRLEWIGVRNVYSYRHVRRLPDASMPHEINGDYIERFELRAKDCGADGAYDQCEHDREHIGWNEDGATPLDEEVWYTFSLMSPTNPRLKVNTILAEWRPQGPGQINLSVELQDGMLAAIVGATAVEQQDDMKPPPITKWGALKYLAPGQWYEFKLRAVFSRHPAKGQIELYLADKVVFRHEGANTAFDRPVHMQYGIYRPFVSKAGTDPLPTQVFFFDNVHKGASEAELAAID